MFVDFNILNQLGSPSINSNTFANRPSAGQVGRLFVSTDTFEIYRDNGTGWDLIGGPGSSTVTGSGAAGQVTYWTGTNSVGGENNLWWDAANNHLGINTSTPGVALDVHSAADVGMQLNGTGGTPNIYIDFLQTGTSEYRLGYTDGAVDDRRFSIYDVTGAKEVLTIDKQSRYVGINFQYSSLTDQPQYMLDLSGGSFHTNVGQYLVGTPTDLTRSFAASGNANSIAVWLEEYGNVTASADIFFIKGRGTDTAKLNVQVGDSLGGFAFTGYLNAQYNQSVIIGTTVTNLDTTNNQANSDFTIQQSYNSAGLTENFRIVANGGNADIRGSVTAASFIPDTSTIPTNGMFLPSANTLAFATNTAQRITLSSTGNVGIGNAAPVSLLSLAGAFAKSLSNEDTWHLQIRDNTAMTTGVGGGIVLTGNYTSGGSGASFAAINSYKENATSSNGAAQLRFYTADAFSILNLCGLFTSSGNFLIGKTTDNSNKLQVNGNISLNGNLQYLDYITPSNNLWESYHYIDNSWRLNYNGSGSDELILFNTGDLQIRGSYKSATPVGGTAANWKLGTRVAAAVVLDATQYIELDVNGTLYKLAIVT